MKKTIDDQIRDRLIQAKSIAIVSHIRPDGDAVGSLLGFGTALKKSGKSVQFVLQDGIPEKYIGLANSHEVRQELDDGFDTLIVVDSSDLARTGSCISAQLQPDICIDHHKTNTNFAIINLVEVEAVATAAILADHLLFWDLEIDKDVASCLLTGIIADTIGFRTSNMNAEAMRLSAELMDRGANLSLLYNQVLINRSFNEIQYWGKGLIKLSHNNGLIWTTLTLNDRISAGYLDNDDADLINVLSSISEAKIALIFVEQDNGSVKVSWRANSGIDVSELAYQFGGGGHAAAAGADIKGELSFVKESVLIATEALLDKDFRKKSKKL